MHECFGHSVSQISDCSKSLTGFKSIAFWNTITMCVPRLDFSWPISKPMTEHSKNTRVALFQENLSPFINDVDSEILCEPCWDFFRASWQSKMCTPSFHLTVTPAPKIKPPCQNDGPPSHLLFFSLLHSLINFCILNLILVSVSWRGWCNTIWCVRCVSMCVCAYH